MKIIRMALVLGLLCLPHLLPAQTLTTTSSQPLDLSATEVPAISSLSEEQLTAFVNLLNATPTLTPAALPLGGNVGTFWSLQNPTWPPLPFDTSASSVWPMSDGGFLLNDATYDYNAPTFSSRRMGAMDDEGGGMYPPGYDGSDTNDYTDYDSVSTPPDYGTNLWIAQTQVTNNLLTGIGSNTLAGVTYTIQSRTNLVQSDWQFEGYIYGSELTNWTPLSVAQNSRTNLFIRLRSEASGDGSGLPDWWEAQYGLSGVDPNSEDSAGDGWTVYQKYSLGVNPNTWFTPAAPQGFTVAYNANNNTATLNWLSAPGSVVNYTVERAYSYLPTYGLTPQVSDFTVSPATYGDDVSSFLADPTSGGNINVAYKVRANYAGGNSGWSASVPLEPATFAGNITGGSLGAPILTVATMPLVTTAIRLTEINWGAINSGDYAHAYVTNFEVSINQSNLAYILPNVESDLDSDDIEWEGQAIGSDGSLSANASLALDYVSNPDSDNSWMVTPFYDGRIQLKQNLIFRLRAAGTDKPFKFYYYVGDEAAAYFQELYDPPTNYVEASFINVTDNVTDTNYLNPYDYYALHETLMDPALPFVDNALLENFVFNSVNTSSDSGIITTGVGYWDVYDGGAFTGDRNLALDSPPQWYFQTNWSTVVPLLATNDTRWLCSLPVDSSSGSYYSQYYENGIVNSGDYGEIYALTANTKNIFGLQFLTEKIAFASDSGLVLQNISAGDSYTVPEDIESSTTLYAETAQPQLETVEYDFWTATPIWNPGISRYVEGWLPGSHTFSTSSQSQQLITAVGAQTQIAGYAKMAVLNGNANTFAYLGQYFEAAYVIDDSGNVTTNLAGVVSPYGNFFATEPGEAALVTMPDLDTGEQGTCMVYAVSLQLDKNHDGNMDLALNGTDATSPDSPMEAWVNNGHTEPGQNGNLDFDLAVPPTTTNYLTGQITCQRDLENFFRLWICGVPSLAFSNGYSATLTCTTLSGSPAINVYLAETNGGIGYLTDTNVAQGLVNEWPIGTAGSGGRTCIFPNDFFDGTNKYLLFEGAGVGEGQFTLTIYQGTTAIAQTSTYIDLHDVEDFYERAIITNNTSGVISNWTSGVEMVQPASASALGDDTNLIVFVHGFNVGNWDWLNDSGTVFKRLYWANYQGKFMTVHWPAIYLNLSLAGLETALGQNTSIFNGSEIRAYKAGSALASYLSQLRTRFPNYELNVLAHSQGNAVMGEAMEHGAPFDNYIMTQAAMPASSYDMDAPMNSSLTTAEAIYATPQLQPMGYQGIYTNMIGNIVNFYNTNDPVLAVWEADQAVGKPDGYANYLLFSPAPHYSYDGTDGWYNGLTSFYMVTDPQESRAMISRSLTLSIGQSPPESAHGIIQSGIDLKAHFGFNNAFPADHSAEWTWPVQTTRPYYLQVINSISQ